MLKTKIEKTTSSKREHILMKRRSENWDHFLSSAISSFEERRTARSLTRLNWQIQSNLLGRNKNRREHALRADWMTRRSIDLYGSPSIELTRQIMRRDIDSLRSVHFSTKRELEDQQKLFAWYRKLGVVGTDVSLHSHEKLTTRLEKNLKAYFDEKFGFISAYIQPQKIYNAQATKKVVRDVLKEFTRRDERFSQWSVSMTKDNYISVSSENKTISIGENRSVQVGYELAATLMHEFVAHVLRSVNGESRGIYEAQHGFDGYTAFEEGLGGYIEFLFTGTRPTKLDSRYIAASLALGQLGNHPYGPDEVFSLLSLRLKLLLKAKGMKSSYIKLKISELKPLVIHRLFRGGLSLGAPYPIYTRDRLYAEGFEVCRAYVLSELRRRVKPNVLVNYLLSAKFDPTNKRHVRALKKI